MDGKVREFLPDEVTSIKQIKEALRNRIRPNSLKVVAGRITALSIKDNNYADFAKNVEDLAEITSHRVHYKGKSTRNEYRTNG